MINLKRLKATLLISGLQQKDQPLFQVINQLIDALQEFINTTNTALGPGGGGAVTNITNNLLQLIESSTDGGGDSLVIPGPIGPTGATGTSGSGVTIPGMDGLDGNDQYWLIPSNVIDTYASPLTNGNGEAPEIVFDSFGDVVMVTGIPT